MIIILGQNLIVWSGIFAGIFFILTFSGCRCTTKLRFPLTINNHNIFMKATIAFFIIHISLNLLGKIFSIWI